MAIHSVKIVNGRKVHSFKYERFELRDALIAEGINQWSPESFRKAMKLKCISHAIKDVKYNRF